MKEVPIHKVTIKDQIYDVLRQEIIEGILRPGDKIVEQNLADRLNVSRSPIREAIKQLVGDGLLTYIPNQGAFVKQLSAKEVQDSYDVRIMLEEYAIKHIDDKLREKYGKQMLKLRKKMEQAMEDLSITQYLLVDRDLHALIIHICDNKVVWNFYEKLWGQIAPFRTISLMSDKRLKLSMQEHINILDGIMEHKDEEALEVLQVHLQEARSTVNYYLYKSVAEPLIRDGVE